jgi:hypothetical protein
LHAYDVGGSLCCFTDGTHWSDGTELPMAVLA